MGDRPLRIRAPVNYSLTTPVKWQTPEKERAKERLKRKKIAASSNEAAGDKENDTFSFAATVAQELPAGQALQQYTKKCRPRKKQLDAPVVGVTVTADPDVESTKQAASKVQKGIEKKVGASGGEVEETAVQNVVPRQASGAEDKEKDTGNEVDAVQSAVEKRALGKGGAGKQKQPALDKKRVTKAVASAAAAAVKARGKKNADQVSRGSTRATKTRDSNGSQSKSMQKTSGLVPQEGATAGVRKTRAGAKGKSAASAPFQPEKASGVAKDESAAATCSLSLESQPKKAKRGAKNGSADAASKPAQPEKARAGAKNSSAAADSEPPQPEKAPNGRKRKAQVVELDGDEADGLPPQKKIAGPSAELVPFIEASKAAAERQRELLGPGVAAAHGKQMAAFTKLQGAYEKLQTKYEALKKSALHETEALFEEQKKVVKIHGEAATKLVNHWKTEVERLQQERATVAETARQARDLTHENARLNMTLVEQEEKRLVMESRFQELQAELQDAMQRTIECAKPLHEAVSVEVQVPSPEARAIWATDAGVQTDELPQEGPVLPSNNTAEKQTKSAKEAADFKQGPTAEPTSTSSPTPEKSDVPPSGPVQLPRGPFKVAKDGLHSRPSDAGFEFPTVGQDGSYGERAPEQEGLGQGFRESLGEGLREGLGEGLEAADLMVGDPDEDSAWRELLQIVTGYCADSCGENKIRFTHEDSGLVFFLTGTPKEDDVTGDVSRELDTLSRASSFFDADRAEDCQFLYEPAEFGLLDANINADSGLRRPQNMTMQEVPRLVSGIMAHTLGFTKAK